MVVSQAPMGVCVGGLEPAQAAMGPVAVGRTPLRAPPKDKELFQPGVLAQQGDGGMLHLGGSGPGDMTQRPEQGWSFSAGPGGRPSGPTELSSDAQLFTTGLEGHGYGGFQEPDAGQQYAMYDPSGPAPGTVVAVECQPGEGGAQGEGHWNMCWEWANTGWCPRGLSCRWEHPPLGVAAFGFWGEGDGEGKEDSTRAWSPCRARAAVEASAAGLAASTLAFLAGDLAAGTAMGAAMPQALSAPGAMVNDMATGMPQPPDGFAPSTPRGD
eukprot:CAMPEP_0176073800 /NCGR_PEP_ID=MMETSP0120_2-20121206/36876_1 /TAXON_ID=160619 /ORGANISM="Kryptoperidinium foliaceum, Strain CCMP 1326" /LENGTH=268 /DNA_ID=CAMNT_0017407485 /DNA_START=1 /DNA_END=806 /DNA_ORIENTATION=-